MIGNLESEHSVSLQAADKRQLAAHTFVGRFTPRCYKIIKTKLSEGKVKSSTFNKLRTLDESEMFAALTKYKESGYDKNVMDNAADRAKAKQDQVIGLMISVAPYMYGNEHP